MRHITISFCALLLICLHFSSTSATLDRILADPVVVTPSVSVPCGNSLLNSEGSKKGLIKGLVNSTVVTKLNFCTSLNGSQSCCAAEDINNASAVLSELSVQVDASLKKVDLSYVTTRNFLNNLTANFKELGEIYVRSEKAILDAFKSRRILAEVPSLNSFVSPNLTNLLNLIRIPPNLIAFNARVPQINITINQTDLLGSYLGAFKNISNALDTDFPLYQAGRKKCFDHLMDTYSRFYCLACNPNVSEFYYVQDLKERLRIHTNSCVTLMNECYDYVSYNEAISGFQHSEQLNDTVNSTNNLLVLFRSFDLLVNNTIDEVKKAGNDESKIAVIVTEAFNKSAILSYQIDNVTEWGRVKNRDFVFSVVPKNCENSTACVTICERFYSEHGVDLNLVLSNPTDRIETILPGISNSNGVNYTTDGVVLEKIVSGLESLNSTEVPVNPANVDGGSSGNKDGNYAAKLVIGTVLLAVIAIIN